MNLLNERESKIVLNYGFHAVDSGFQIPRFRIPRANISGIRECLFPCKGRLNGHFRDTLTILFLPTYDIHLEQILWPPLLLFTGKDMCLNQDHIILFFFLSNRYCSLLELHFHLGFRRSGEPYISLKE